MMPIFAQLQAADPMHVRDMLLFIGFLLSSVASAVSIIVMLTGRGAIQKREVQMAEVYATKNWCDEALRGPDRRLSQVESEITGLRGVMSENRDAIECQLRDGIKGVHSRVDKLIDAMAALQEKVGEIKGELRR